MTTNLQKHCFAHESMVHLMSYAILFAPQELPAYLQQVEAPQAHSSPAATKQNRLNLPVKSNGP